MIVAYCQVNDIVSMQVSPRTYHGDIFVVTQRVEVSVFTQHDHRPYTVHICSHRFTFVLPFIGDLYGGSHYSKLCSASMTPQGRAIQEATTKFGDGKTLPYTPCKKGYIPYHKFTGERLYACMYHNKARRRRLVKNNTIVLRDGEVDFNKFEIIGNHPDNPI